MAPVTIIFSDHTAVPPVFVAGSFTDWKPVEITATPKQGEEGQYAYEKKFDLVPGTYQYKFRLGEGDWWVCDHVAPMTRDDAGNENNQLVVEAEPEKLISAATHAPYDTTGFTKVNGVAKIPSQTEVKASEPPKVEQPVQIAKADKVEPVAATEEPKIVQEPLEAQKAISQPVSNNVDGAVSPEPAVKKTDSKESSVSSLPPQEKASEKKEHEPKKQSWFSRIFLCGSSKMVLAAVVVTVPILLAYVIQK